MILFSLRERRPVLMPILILLAGVIPGLIASTAHAEHMNGFYMGGGFYRSWAKYKAAAADSSFNGWGGAVIAGTTFGSETFSLFLEGELGRTDALNTLQNATYLEKSNNNYYAGRAGMMFGSFGLGGGVQQNRIDIDNVATTASSGRTTYSGLSYMGFARLSFEGKRSFQTIIEAKYGFGQVSGLDMSETQLGLRFVFSPF